MKKTFYFFLIISCLLIFKTGYSQVRKITGTIISDGDKNPLPGASVIIKGTSTGVTTDIDGKYTISVKGKQTLIYSFIGYKAKEIKLDNQTVIDVTLKEDILKLEETVVVGYAVQKKKDITGSVASVSSDDIKRMPVQSLDQALQGRAAGVTVTSSSGLPGAAVSVRIRGNGSINASNAPLYIIDGVQINSGDDSSILNSSNPLSGINPDDIERFDILKDAASTSIYGAQAANGVIIITTKSGRKGKTKFKLSSSYGISQVVKNIDMLNSAEWTELSLKAYENYAKIYKRGSSKYLNRYQGKIDTYKKYGLIQNSDGTLDFSKMKTYDWQDDVFRNAAIKNIQLSASGGSDKTQFYVSGSYNTTEGTVIETDFRRITLNSRIKHKVNKKLSIHTNIKLSSVDQNNSADGTSYANPYRHSMLTVPLNNPYLEDGSYASSTDFVGNYVHNVIQEAYYNKRKGRSNKVIASLGLEYKILKDLVYKVNGSIDYNEITERKFYDPRTMDGAAYGGRVTQSNFQRENLQFENTLNWDKTIGFHKINALGGFSYRHEITRNLDGTGNVVPSEDFQYLSSTATPDDVSGSKSEWKLVGLFTKLNYTYNDKYIAGFTLRRDGSSRFGENNKWVVFPSFSAAWRISSEPFMQNLKFIDNLKLKVGYGVTGNTKGIGYYTARKRYTSIGAYNNIAAIYPSSIGNVDLTWEEKVEFNTGLDFTLFEGRIDAGIDVYKENRTNLLYSRPMPSTSGYSSRTENLGEVENKGIEFYLNTVNFNINGLKWTSSFNIAHNKNKVVALIDNADKVGYSLKVGMPINSYYTYKWAGINPADGRAMYYDKNGNITYKPTSEDRTWLNKDPDFTGGLGNKLSYKGIELSVFFQFSYGGRAYSGDFYRTARAGSSGDRNQLQSQYNDYWQKPGDKSWVGIPMYSGYYYKNQYYRPYSRSTRSYLHTDYLRLKNVNLSYQLPKSIINKLNVGGLEVYAQATNLWTVTNYLGWDPEFTGDDTGVYPQSKNYTFGVKLTF